VPSSGGGFVGSVADASAVSSTGLPDSEYISMVWNPLIDTDGFHSNANSERFTIPVGKAGTYLVMAQVQFDANGVGNRYVLIGLNEGYWAYPISEASLSASATKIMAIQSSVTLSVGDYISIKAKQTSGSSIGAYLIAFSAQKIT
jgi:hypothetical protein